MRLPPSEHVPSAVTFCASVCNNNLPPIRLIIIRVPTQYRPRRLRCPCERAAGPFGDSPYLHFGAAPYLIEMGYSHPLQDSPIASR